MNSLLSISAAAAMYILSMPQLREQISIPVEIAQGGIVCIEPDNASCPRPASERLALADGEEGRLNISFDDAGTYTYRLYQKGGNDPMVSYDRTDYILTVYTGENGRVESVILQKEGSEEKAASVSWDNIRRKNPALTLDPSYVKGYAFTSVGALLMAAVLFKAAGGNDEQV